MHQVKMFNATESNVAGLEEVNAWIRSTGAQVLSVTGTLPRRERRVPERSGVWVGEVSLRRTSS